MKRTCLILCAAAAALSASVAPAQEAGATATGAVQHAASPVPADAVTFVIPLREPISRGLLYDFRRGLREAAAEEASMIVLHMDTPGGGIQETEQILRLLLDQPVGVRTVTFVDKDALSAGALIALATDDIYMAPTSRIYATEIIRRASGHNPGGDATEKYLASIEALARRAAVLRGHDPRVVEAMMRREGEKRIGDLVVPDGRLLILTDINADRMMTTNGVTRPLLAAGRAASLDELLRKLGRPAQGVRTWSRQRRPRPRRRPAVERAF
jgi:membrane-bound serine protease (ClpP class)